MIRSDGLQGLPCWNGLSLDQQTRLIEWGNLPFGWVGEGSCTRPADILIETRWDKSPGARFYCLACGIEYLKGQEWTARVAEIR